MKVGARPTGRKSAGVVVMAVSASRWRVKEELKCQVLSNRRWTPGKLCQSIGGTIATMNPPPSMPIAVSAASIAGDSRITRFLTVSLARELGILLSLSVLFPFMIHILPLPDNARWGPRLLPIFYAPLLAVLWGRAQTALLVALLAPWLNWVLTTHPPPPIATVMMVQLLGFVLTLRFLLSKLGPRWFLAAPAFLAGLAGSALVTAVFPALIGGQMAVAWATRSLVMGLPGIAILVVINWLSLRHYPPGANGGGPMAA